MAVLEGGLFLTAKHLGSLMSSAAVVKAELCCAASPCDMGSGVWGREQGGNVEERQSVCLVFVKSVGYSWISNRADAGWRRMWGVGKQRKGRMGSGFVSVCAEGRVTGRDLQCFVLGGSSLLQGTAAGMAQETQLASCERQEKKVGCSREALALTQNPNLCPGQ